MYSYSCCYGWQVLIMNYLCCSREPHRRDAERQRRARRRGRAHQARESADHQRGERGDRGALGGEDRGGSDARELALQITQQEEEEVQNPVLPEEEQEERESGSLEERERERERGPLCLSFCLSFYVFEFVFVKVMYDKNMAHYIASRIDGVTSVLQRCAAFT